MSEQEELKLACLHQAGGNLDHAKALFDWVSGSVRATPDSEAAEVSAPKQDKPQQPFNYQHPSKYGTDVPRRCYLEELTPEERAIRDLVDTVERLGAHPLLTATVIQLMKAGEDLADWVDIGLRDKAIAALSPGNDLGLLDDGQQETSPVQSAIDQDKAWQSDGLGQLTPHPWSLISAYRDGYEGRKHIAPHHPAYMREYNIGAAAKASNADIPPAQEAPAIPEDWTRHDGGECPLRAGVDVDLRFRDGSTYFNSIGLGDFRKNWSWDCSEPAQIVAYRENQASADAERTSDESQATDQDRAEQADLLLENQPGVSSQASSGEVARKAELEEANRGEIIRKIAAANAYHEVRFGDRWRVGSELESQPGVSDEGAPVLDAGPPSIRRSDIPEGVAVETYTDSGLETVKLGGQTYVVDLDRVETKPGAVTILSEPEAAYAPVNEDDGLMWSNAFKAEAEAKAEEPEAKRPFWMFRPKVDA